jgi:hypothetical protein
MEKPPPHTKITHEQRAEITRRVLAGESSPALAKEFGVTRSYVSLLKNTALDPKRFEREREKKLKVKLTAEQRDELERLFQSSTPAAQDLIPAREYWSLDHGFQLATKLFQKKPGVKVMKELLAPYLKRSSERSSEWADPKPQPPGPRNIKELDPELAADPDFVAYYLSAVYEKIRWREYEIALEDWERRHAGLPECQSEDDWDEPPPAGPDASLLPAAPGQRTGKHAGSKGLPFTRPKRRKKTKH